MKKLKLIQEILEILILILEKYVTHNWTYEPTRIWHWSETHQNFYSHYCDIHLLLCAKKIFLVLSQTEKQEWKGIVFSLSLNKRKEWIILLGAKS